MSSMLTKINAIDILQAVEEHFNWESAGGVLHLVCVY